VDSWRRQPLEPCQTLKGLTARLRREKPTPCERGCSRTVIEGRLRLKGLTREAGEGNAIRPVDARLGVGGFGGRGFRREKKRQKKERQGIPILAEIVETPAKRRLTLSRVLVAMHRALPGGGHRYIEKRKSV